MTEKAKPLISVIVARADNGVIGRDNTMPWRLRNDLRYFKQVTMGKPVIMGRKTFESIGKPLPGRLNIVITRQYQALGEGVVVVPSLQAAIALASGEGEEIMIIGGTQIYQQAIPLASRIYMTKVRGMTEGDVVFPALEKSEWQQTVLESYSRDEHNDWDHEMVLMERIAPS